MKLDLHRLRHVVTVAELRSFSRAAEALAITQPALSRSIASLEEDLGLRIFDRGRAGVFITQAGVELVAGAEKLLGQAQALEQNALQSRDAGFGVIKFGMAPLVASIYLPRLLARLAEAYPSLILRPTVRKGEELLNLLPAGELELCFIASNYLTALDQIGTDVISTIPIALFARAEHPLLRKSDASVDDLRDYPFAASVAEFPGRLGAPPLVTSIVCDNYFLMRELMLASNTVCLMSPLLLREELQSGRVKPLDIKLIDQVSFDLCTIRLLSRTASPSARLVLDQLIQLARPGG
jgi:DNA-binding transcriptional LysR family regulator